MAKLRNATVLEAVGEILKGGNPFSATKLKTKNMKYILANLGVNLVALVCIGAAGYLATNDKNGWGWFLFVGLLCIGSVTFTKSDK